MSHLMPSAIGSKMAELQRAVKMSRERLAPFERKYGVTSEYFMSEMVAEDLEGGDIEYVEWAGEYKLMQSAQEELWELQQMADLEKIGDREPDV